MDREYVARALALADLRLEETRIDAVAGQLERIGQIASILDAVELDPADELAPVWRP